MITRIFILIVRLLALFAFRAVAMLRFAWLGLAAGELIDEFNVLSIFQHAEGYRCKTRMFSAPTNPPESMPVLERALLRAFESF